MSPARRFRPLLLLLVAAALLATSVWPSQPVAAQQSDPPARVIWSAIMTVGTSTDRQSFGYSSNDSDFENDALSVTTFEYGSTTYTFEKIEQEEFGGGGGTGEGFFPGFVFGTYFSFTVSPIPPDTASSKWILDVDGAEFSVGDVDLSDDDQTENWKIFVWDIDAISFEGGAMVPLSLKVLNWPATGHPAITGTSVPGETLTADVSGITDPDGPTNPTYTYEWLDSGLIPIGTGPTYTVSEDDLGTVITLRVSFEDDAGYKEVLTSDELWVHTRLDLHSDNDSARDIWGNATTIWVSDGTDDKIYAYHRLDASRDSSQDFNSLSGAGNNTPRGIWSDGTTMYVADWSDDKVYAYKMSDKSHDSAKDFTFDSDNTIPTGMWGNADTIWVANDGSGPGSKLFAYKRSDGTHDPDKDFDTLFGAGNVAPRGIWSDGATMYVSDRSDKVYAYKMSDQSHDPARDFDLHSDNEYVAGIWAFAANKFYAVDIVGDRLYIYTVEPDIWSAAMTVGTDPNDPDDLGWSSSANSYDGDALDMTTVNIGSTTYSLTSISLAPLNSQLNHLSLEIAPKVTADDVSDLVLLVDGQEFPLYFLLPFDNPYLTGTHFSWFTAISWTASQSVSLQIVERNSLATGLSTITGTPQEGEVLSADVSGITDDNGMDNAQFFYQWLKDGDPIPGTQAPDYWPHRDDVGSRISVRVSFLDNANYEEGPFTSAETAPVQDSDTVEVVWSATMTVGEASGTFGYDIDENPVQGSLSPTSFDYAGNTYEVEYLYHDLPVINLVISPSLPGVFFTFVHGPDNRLDRRLGTPGEYDWEVADPDWSVGDKVALAIIVPVNFPATGDVIVIGTPQEGEPLAADVSGISDDNGLDDAVYTYQWLKNGSEIEGAEASVYWPHASDVGSAISVQVSFKDDDGFTEGPLTSAQTAAVQDSDTVHVVWSATITVGYWTAANADAFGYSPLTGEGSLVPDTFTIGGDNRTIGALLEEVGPPGKLSLVLDTAMPVDFSLVYGATGEGDSADTIFDGPYGLGRLYSWSAAPGWAEGDKVALAMIIPVNFPPTGSPTIDGVVLTGNTLTAGTSDIEDDNGLENVSYTYQWVRSDCTDSNNDGDISGETSQTYTVVAADLACVVGVNVTFKDDAGYTHTLYATSIDITEADWALSLSSSSVTENDPNGVEVTLSITNTTTFSGPVTADLYWGTAKVSGFPLAGDAGVHTITVPANSNQGSLTLLVVDEDSYGIPETEPLIARVGNTELARADLTVLDDESPPQVTLSVDETTVTEVDDITLTASLDPAYETPVTISFTTSDPDGVLTGAVPTAFTFSGTQREASLTFTTDNDTVDEPHAEVVFALSTPPNPLTLGDPSSVTVTVLDDDAPPGPPRHVSVVAVDKLLTLWWQRALSPSSAVQHYSYRVSDDDGHNWDPDWTIIEGSGPDTFAYSVGGLTNGVEYTIEVRATNATGDGDAARTKGTPFGPPGPPVVAVSPRYEALSVFWTVPDDGGRKTFEYQVQWRSGDESYSFFTRRDTTTQRNYIIEGLDNGTQYFVRVRARNEEGWGDPSDPAPGIPQRPIPVARDFKTLWPTQTSIALRWFALKDATEYILEYQKGADDGWTRVDGYFDQLPSANRGHRPVAVATGLECDTEYSFRLSARTPHPLHTDLGGVSPHVYASGETGPCADDGRVTNLLVTLAPDCATLSWTAPTGGNAESYRIERITWDVSDTGELGNEREEVVQDDTGNSNTTYRDCSTSYGDPDDAYSYRVSALAADGVAFAPNMTPIQYLGPHSVPEAVRNARLVEDTQSVRRLAWDAPPEPWLTAAYAAREGGMRSVPVPDVWPTTYQVERRVFETGPQGIDDWYFPDYVDETFWTATMTVGFDQADRGFVEFDYGSLSPKTVNHPSGDSYTISQLYVGSGNLRLTLDPIGSTSDFESWVLAIDGKPFLWNADDISSGNARFFQWIDAGLSLNSGETVTVQLKEREYLDWEVLRRAADANADSRTFTDNEHAGGRTYVYRVLAHNSRGFAWHDFNDDWLFDSPIFMGFETAYTPVSNSPATGAPTISGTVQAGQTVTADTSGIDDDDGLIDVSYSYQWVSNDGNADTEIRDATASTYELSDDDVGNTIRVRVTFTDNADNEESLTSAATAAVTARPNNPATGLPTISGTAQAGQTLTADTSGIDDEDGLTNVPYSYQWIRSDGGADTDIAGETASTYTLADDDVGKTIKVRVSFTDNRDNEETVTSAATGPVEEAPQPLTASTHDVPQFHDGETVFTFELRFSEEPRSGFSFKTLRDHAFTVTGGEVTRAKRLEQGSNLRWTIHVQLDGNGSVTIVLPATTDCAAEHAICTEDGRPLSNRLETTVSSPQNADQNNPATGAPTISGNAQAGQTLTADTSGITDADGLTSPTYSYQWVSNDGNADTDIQDATASTYELSDDDVGKTIKVRVTFTDNRDNRETLTSEATAEVTARPNTPATGAPTISGTAQAGQTLTADVAGIDDEDGLTNVTYSYQWVRNDGNTDTDIAGETASTYEVSDDDVGNTIRVKVSFTDNADNEESLTSAATAEVTARPNTPATGLPTISGTVQAGEILTADTSGIDDADGLTSPTFSYQWVSNDGNADSDIQDATASTYEVSDDDVGNTIKVRVTFTDDRDNEETLTSTATDSVDAELDSQDTDAPPGDPSTTVEVTVGDTVAGDIAEASEVDWFKVSLLASETYQIDMRGEWGGEWAEVDGEIVWVSAGTLVDPKLLGVFGEDDALVPGTDEEVSGNDRGDSSEGKNSRIASFSPPADGYYYIAAAAEDAWTGTYELTVTVVVE